MCVLKYICTVDSVSYKKSIKEKAESSLLFPVHYGSVKQQKPHLGYSLLDFGPSLLLFPCLSSFSAEQSEKQRRGLRDGSVYKSSRYSCTGLGSIRAPGSVSQSTVTAVPGDLLPSSGPEAPGSHGVHIYTHMHGKHP